MVDDGKIARRLPIALGPVAFIDAGKIVKKRVRPGNFVLQEVQHRMGPVARNPGGRNSIARRLRHEPVTSELLLELIEDVIRAADFTNVGCMLNLHRLNSMVRAARLKTKGRNSVPARARIGDSITGRNTITSLCLQS